MNSILTLLADAAAKADKAPAAAPTTAPAAAPTPTAPPTPAPATPSADAKPATAPAPAAPKVEVKTTPAASQISTATTKIEQPSKPPAPVKQEEHPIATFLIGMTLLVLFISYMGTVARDRKRVIGTALSVLVGAFFVWMMNVLPLKKGIDLQGGSQFMVQLKPGIDEKGNEKDVSKDSIDQAITILERRLNPTGSKDMAVQPVGKDRIEIQMPGVKTEDIDGVRNQIQQVAKLEFRMVHPQSESEMARTANGGVVVGYVKMPVKDPTGEGGSRFLLVRNRADMDGKHVTTAGVRYDASGWAILCSFDSEGSKLFGELTGAHVNERLAVVVDGEVITAPNIKTAIFGHCEISGSFTEQSARALASALENPLENPMVILQEGSVSAAFGEATIRQGQWAGVVGLALTAIFLAIYYRFAGLIALTGLAISLLAVVGGMCLFQFTLTMPGIAGLVLTIAMAVDANVLIYERLREEMRAGKTLISSLDAAHDRAFTAIFDAHVTTLITSLILMGMGSGMLKGFAITMIIGVFSTLLGALIVTRVFLHWFVDTGIITKLSVAQIIPNRIFDVMKHGRTFLMISLITSGIAILGIALEGKNAFGIDYRGGAKVSFKSNDASLNAETVEAALKTMKIDVKQSDGTSKEQEIGNHYVQASKTAGGDSMITVRTEEYAGPQVQTKLEAMFKGKLEAPKLDTAGAVIGKEQGYRSAMAVVLALLGIFFYLWFRYEVSFALGALVSLLHDVIIELGGSVLFGQELSLVHIGAALTVAGYSVNDTIIVFDRVREIIRTRQGTIKELMNEAVSMTFSRTLLTSLVTFIPMMVLFLFGGPAMREFSLPIVIGVLVGTYSSIFVACPIVLWHARKTGVSLHRQLLREEEQKALGITADHKVA